MTWNPSSVRGERRVSDVSDHNQRGGQRWWSYLSQLSCLLRPRAEPAGRGEQSMGSSSSGSIYYYLSFTFYVLSPHAKVQLSERKPTETQIVSKDVWGTGKDRECLNCIQCSCILNCLKKLKICLQGRVTETSTSILSFTLQRPAIAMAEPGWSQGPTTQSESPTGVAEAQVLGPSPAASQEALQQDAEIGSRARTGPGATLAWDMVVLSGSLSTVPNACPTGWLFWTGRFCDLNF